MSFSLNAWLRHLHGVVKLLLLIGKFGLPSQDGRLTLL